MVNCCWCAGTLAHVNETRFHELGELSKPESHINVDLRLEFPADSAAASTARRVWVIQDPKTAPNKFGGKVYAGAIQEGHGHRIDEYAGRFDRRVRKVTLNIRLGDQSVRNREEEKGSLVAWRWAGCEVHFVLVSVAPTRLDGYSKCGVGVVLTE